MKPFELSRNSWHFYLAAKYGGFRTHYFSGREREHLDFCDYLWAVAWAIVKIAIVLVIATFFCFCFYDLGLWVYESIQAGKFLSLKERLAAIIVGAAGLSLVIGATIGVFMGIIWFATKVQDYHDSKSEPGFIELAIDKFRNKTCVQIKFKD
jgi:hypothetical protein